MREGREWVRNTDIDDSRVSKRERERERERERTRSERDNE